MSLEDKVVIAKQSDTLTSIIKRMVSGEKSCFGIALVIDEKFKLRGVINYGDLLRYLADDTSLEKLASDIMMINPVTALHGTNESNILKSVRSQILKRTSGKKELTQFVPIVDESGVVRDIIDIFQLLTRQPSQFERVVVYGLGFVGLTLAVSLASRGHIVKGVDKNESMIKKLDSGKPHIHEPGLIDMMVGALKDKTLSFGESTKDEHFNVVIIAVGTPVDNDGNVSLEALKTVCRTVAKNLRTGDLVLLRSTVPVGTTRGLVREILEKYSGLSAVNDFNLAFTPERTAEGVAMKELTSLPQIVGGLTKRSVERATIFWQTLTDGIVNVDSVEAAELVKLINNSYRDLSFAFSNGFALLAHNFNLEASRVISAANEGYPRNKIPLPSPGVGGYCLTKDPFLYASIDKKSDYGNLSKLGRRVNENAGLYPYEIYCEYIKRISTKASKLTVLVIGLAFKGTPETNDLRGSLGLSLALRLQELNCNVLGYDAVVDDSTLLEAGIKPVSILEGAQISDILFIMNNHPLNTPDGLLLSLQNRPVLLFDGWSMLDRRKVESYATITYATMGYMTKVSSFRDE